MTPEEREAWSERRREYFRKWHKTNKDKSREASRKWQQTNLDKAKETTRKWRRENHDKLKKYARKWYHANTEKVKESNRKWLQKKRLENAAADALQMIVASAQLLKSIQQLTRENDETQLSK